MAAMLMTVALGACSHGPLGQPPRPGEVTSTSELLQSLPLPKGRVTVAVYGFPDMTGQYKYSETVATYSRAVTQGAAAVLVRALQDAGRGRWFQVVERESLQNLLTERQIIRETRQQYRTPTGEQLPPPPPLLYAGIMLTGGVIGYDTNVVSGGWGTRYLGMGGDVEYREDSVTVYLRGVSTQSGEVMATTTAQKAIASVQVGANIFRYVGYQKLLELDAGLATNEPGMIALQQSVELAVYQLIMEGAMNGLWEFQDPQAGAAALQTYLKEYRRPDGGVTPPPRQG
jgi:curli production assembly/transport component CsgG